MAPFQPRRSATRQPTKDGVTTSLAHKLDVLPETLTRRRETVAWSRALEVLHRYEGTERLLRPVTRSLRPRRRHRADPAAGSCGRAPRQAHSYAARSPTTASRRSYPEMIGRFLKRLLAAPLVFVAAVVVLQDDGPTQAASVLREPERQTR